MPPTTKRILFNPSEYRELSGEEQALLHQGYHKAIEAVRRNITPLGFSACSLEDNSVSGTDANYRSVWARDGAKTVVWTLDLDDEDIRDCQRNTLHTIISHQSPAGHIPAHVSLDTNLPEYGGVGGITAIDSALWIIIAMYRHASHTGDWSLIEEFAHPLQRAMDWLSAHDANNDGLLEIPEAGDWTDLFARSYYVLYDEVLWYRTLTSYSGILRHLGEHERAEDYGNWAQHVRTTIVRSFWPSTRMEFPDGHGPRFSDVQFGMGDSRYLVAQISPFDFSWRCDVYANLLAYLMGVVDQSRAEMTFRFLWGCGVNEPGLVKNLYPPVQAGDPEWRTYFTVNLLNLPNHYHNGGIWPFVGALWVRYIHKLGMPDLARREMVKLARMCAHGVSHMWEFNEWHHGTTGRPMGKAYQAWSAASFVRACHVLELDPDSHEHHE